LDLDNLVQEEKEVFLLRLPLYISKQYKTFILIILFVINVRTRINC